MAAGRVICLKIYQNIDKMHRITLNSTAEKVKKNHFIVMTKANCRLYLIDLTLL